ncbi:hypothetical protein [Herbiconiux sp. L3-i23]|uniref:hypothetical protein n=1 Tax=Herbiconiux sp. L3-i23 TaxID=2905871 RepID=UPI00206D411B|nr:hypothetical protein [Herbiconiux sp. L3-i23]BDI24041.1 hypothetical protein L3i23_28170 [Herbiconiux sp. L3-i23]
MSASRLPALALLGDPRHGVAIAARSIADAVVRIDPEVAIVDLGPRDEAPASRVHVHFTDRLWASSPEAAAERFETFAARSAVTVTLHDVPQPSDGPRNLPRRTEAYRRVVAAARGVVVNSEHEAALLDEAGIVAGSSAVIPLAVDMVPGTVDIDGLDGTVGVLGFFYPGKGHAEVVEALAGMERGPAPRSMVSIGGVSPGHEEELADLIETASSRSVSVEVTGFLPDAELHRRCRAVSVPVVAHRHFSASASLATWIATGRRPIVVSSRYAREMDRLRPGTMTLVGSVGLADAIARAIAEPASTVLAEDAVLAPAPEDTAAAYLGWWRGDTP